MAAKDSKTSGDAGEAEVQAKVDEANEKGYFGETVDPTPNENYTVAGVTSGKPTPETDKAAAVAASTDAVSARFDGGAGDPAS